VRASTVSCADAGEGSHFAGGWEFKNCAHIFTVNEAPGSSNICCARRPSFTGSFCRALVAEVILACDWLSFCRPLFSLAFCLFCALPPLVKISLRAHLLVAVALFILYLGQNRAWRRGKILNKVFRAQTTHTKTQVLAITFRVPMSSVSPYLNPHISAESWLMKTTKPSYFIVALRRSIFRSQKYFLLLSSPPTVMTTSWYRHLNKLQVEVEDGFLKKIETGKPHLKKLVMINRNWVVLIQHDPGELRGL